MKRVLALTASLLVATGTAMAAGELMTSAPPSSQTVTDWYKQSVYDPTNEKDVAVNFEAIKKTTKNNSTYLTMNATKDALKSAPGFKYDREKTTWVPDTSSK